MTDEQARASGPDLRKGVPLSTIADGTMLAGHVDGEPALLARDGDALFAVGGECTHYGAPLAEGLLVGETVRCQWHHACFSLRTGEALRAPALDAVRRWRVETIDDVVYVREKLLDAEKQPHIPSSGTPTSGMPASVVIVGGGAAGNAAAEMLRRLGFSGEITMFSADEALPCDRPKLSKSYLSGDEDEASAILRSTEFYRQHCITLRLGMMVVRIDTTGQRVLLADGSHRDYDRLLLATGAEPTRLDVPGSRLPHVRTLRTLADSRAIIAATATAKRAVVIGSSFIGLEVASSLRARHIEVDVVAQEACPMETVLGTEIGTFIRKLHETRGVTFHLRTTVTSIDARGVTLKTGEHLKADLVVIGIGVRPVLSLAEQAGLTTDHGLIVDAFLETSAPGIFAAGDIARWPDPAQRRAHPRGALGRRGASGANRRAQHSGSARTVRYRSVLLDHPIRFRSRLHRSRHALR
jgi:NADPH-dependent 2,4-dienoyl-CoA reductase/sulfur reductase-like enzyme/nitrite reductase/ring-hydroxylating ferredoxin subunit